MDESSEGAAVNQDEIMFEFGERESTNADVTNELHSSQFKFQNPGEQTRGTALEAIEGVALESHLDLESHHDLESHLDHSQFKDDVFKILFPTSSQGNRSPSITETDQKGTGHSETDQRDIDHIKNYKKETDCYCYGSGLSEYLPPEQNISKEKYSRDLVDFVSDESSRPTEKVSELIDLASLGQEAKGLQAVDVKDTFPENTQLISSSSLITDLAKNVSSSGKNENLVIEKNNFPILPFLPTSSDGIGLGPRFSGETFQSGGMEQGGTDDSGAVVDCENIDVAFSLDTKPEPNEFDFITADPFVLSSDLTQTSLQDGIDPFQPPFGSTRNHFQGGGDPFQPPACSSQLSPTHFQPISVAGLTLTPPFQGGNDPFQLPSLSCTVEPPIGHSDDDEFTFESVINNQLLCSGESSGFARKEEVGDDDDDDEFDFDEMSLSRCRENTPRINPETVEPISEEAVTFEADFGEKCEESTYNKQEILKIGENENGLSLETETSNDEWDQVQTIEPDFNSENGAKEAYKASKTETQSIMFDEAVGSVSSDQLTQQYKDVIKTSVVRSRLSSFFHRFCGGPKLHQSLHDERDLAFCLAACPFSNDNSVHIRVLYTLFKRLTGSKFDCPRYGNHWEQIGFQGHDPATDLRSAGFYALLQLLHLVTDPKTEALGRSLYRLSQHETQNFPFCLMGINLTRITMAATREDKLNRECNRRKQVMAVMNDFYVGMFQQLYITWKTQYKTISDTGFVLADLETNAKKRPEEMTRMCLQTNLSHSAAARNNVGDDNTTVTIDENLF